MGAVNQVTSRAKDAGNFFESFDIQVLTLCFVFLDVAAATALVALRCDATLESATTAAVLNVLQVGYSCARQRLASRRGGKFVS